MGGFKRKFFKNFHKVLLLLRARQHEVPRRAPGISHPNPYSEPFVKSTVVLALSSRICFLKAAFSMSFALTYELVSLYA